MLSNNSKRSCRENRENGVKALRAATTALSTSDFDPNEMTPAIVSSAGFVTSKLFGVTGSIQLPFT